MNAKQIALGGWVACILSWNTLADSASLPESWHASQQSSLAAPYSTVTGNGLNVRVGGFSSDVLLSRDGTRWACHNSGIANSLYSVAFGQERFVAVGNEGALVFSSEGARWTKRNLETEDRLQSVKFDNNTFVAASKQGQLISSTDGKHWNIGAPATSLVSVK